MSSASDRRPLIVNGWSIFAHPVFIEQLELLLEEVSASKARQPFGYERKNCSKRLAAILKLMTQDIPDDPGGARFRQGDTLGPSRRHWFRARFFQQFRLFYRFDSTARIIVLGWVNDDETLRSYGSRVDAYAVFRSMLADGMPPDDFPTLLAAARQASHRLSSSVDAAAGLTARSRS